MDKTDPAPPPAAPPPTTPRPLFIYGTLCAQPLLAWVVTGNAANVADVVPLLHPARVAGYRRVAVHNCDYPAVIPDASASVDGFVLQPLTASQRRKLDDFEGEAYRPVAVAAQLVRGTGGGEAETDPADTANDTVDTATVDTATVDADLYVWAGDDDKLSTESWDLDTFVRERLEDWLDLFDGMEMVGDGSDAS